MRLAIPSATLVSLAVAGTALLAGLAPAVGAQGGDEPPPCTTATAYPDAFNITPPATGLPRELSAFSGVWEGTWSTPSGPLPARLIVEAIDGATARLIYANGAGAGTSPGVFRTTARVLPDNRLRWDSGIGPFTFTMSSDLSTIQGSLDNRTGLSTVVLTRCSWQ